MLRPRMALISCLLACACADDGTSSTGGETGPTVPATGTTGTGGDLPTGASDPGTAGTQGPDTTADTTTNDTPVDPNTTGTPAACEANPLCEGPGSCGECSLGDRCSDASANCDATPGDACNAYLQCEDDSRDDAAYLKTCGLQYPDGYDPAWALLDCVRCTACADSCAATAAAYCASGGGGPGKTETCDQIGDCGLCHICSLDRGCATAVQNCTDEPQCQAYDDCFYACAADDLACKDLCEEMYPAGYAAMWAQYDCAVCDECPSSCPEQQPYCMAGGGGPNSECASNADCVELYDGLPFCVQQKCVECLSDDNCLNRGAFVCMNGFCV